MTLESETSHRRGGPGPPRNTRAKSRRDVGSRIVVPPADDTDDADAGPTCADGFYRQLIESAAEGTLLVSHDGTVLFANPRICEILAVDHQQLIGRSVLALVDRASSVTYEQLTEWSAPSAAPVALLLIAGGERRVPVRVTASEVTIADEPATALLITDLSLEAAAEATATLQAALLDASADAIVARDAADQVTYLNAAAEQLFGWRREHVIGRSWTDLAMAPGMTSNTDDVLQTLTSGGIWSTEFEVHRLDGSSVWVQVKESAIFTVGGELSTIIAAATDITARRMAQEELTTRERWFRGLVAGSSDLIAVVQADTTLIYANPAAALILGFDPAEESGRRMLDLVHPDDLDAVVSAFTAGLGHRGTNPPATFRFKTRDGGWRVLEATSTNCLDDPAIAAVIINGRDVTNYVRVERARDTLSRASELVVHATDEPSLLRHMCEAITEAGGYDLAWIGQPDHDQARTVRPVAAAGQVEMLSDLHVSWGDTSRGIGVTGTAIRTRATQAINDSRHAARTFAPWKRIAAQHNIRAVCAIPLQLGGEVWALSIYSTDCDVFDPDSLAVLEKLGQELVYGIGRLRDTERLNRSMLDTVAAVAATIEHRDPYTAGHQRRVAQLAAAIAKRMGLDSQRILGIAVGATVHDIGKIAMPAEILSRPGRLSEIEYELIKTHAAAGSTILTGIEFSWPVADIVRHHHERFDGSGYPDGLRGDEITLDARIVSVADVVEAMSAHRPYRPALGLSAAITEIAAGSGTRYDPQVAKTCLDVLKNGFAFDDVTDERRWIATRE